jgi:hypothetical protein
MENTVRTSPDYITAAPVIPVESHGSHSVPGTVGSKIWGLPLRLSPAATFQILIR